MYVKEFVFDNTPEFLKSSHYINFTHTVTDTGIEADEYGKKYILSGSLISEAGALITFDGTDLSDEPIGILFDTIDVTHGSQPAPILVEGYVITERLQIDNPDSAKKILQDKLPNIKFM